jgi:hypothetical protein
MFIWGFVYLGICLFGDWGIANKNSPMRVHWAVGFFG